MADVPHGSAPGPLHPNEQQGAPHRSREQPMSGIENTIPESHSPPSGMSSDLQSSQSGGTKQLPSSDIENYVGTPALSKDQTSKRTEPTASAKTRENNGVLAHSGPKNSSDAKGLDCTTKLNDLLPKPALPEKNDGSREPSITRAGEAITTSQRTGPTAHKSKADVTSILKGSQRASTSSRAAVGSQRASVVIDSQPDEKKPDRVVKAEEAPVAPLKRRQTGSWTLRALGYDDTSERLEDLLADSMERSMVDHHRKFIPEGKFQSLMTLSSVELELARQEHSFRKRLRRLWRPPADKKEIQNLARTICPKVKRSSSQGDLKDDEQSGPKDGKQVIPKGGKQTTLKDGKQDASKGYRKIFAILLLIDRPYRIKSLIKANVCDDDLPLVEATKDPGRLASRHAPDTPLPCFKKWAGSTIARFEEWQWAVLAPIFECGNSDRAVHYPLQSRDILPFTSWEALRPRVYKATIHDDHHNFGQRDGSKPTTSIFAIKELFTDKKDKYKQEVRILSSLRAERHRHNHLVELLATFQQNETYYLVFPMAEADLVGYWKDVQPTPSRDRSTALWLAEQCYGIADGLNKIHHWETLSGSSLVHQSSIPQYGDAQAGTQTQPNLTNGTEMICQLFGRHGDIKPNNILWFSNGGRGVLKITDFGIAHFSTKTSVLAQSRGYTAISPPYRAPESDLPNWMLNSSYDTWSLGCVYLEFITWFFGGWNGVNEFSKRRLTVDPKYYFWKTPTFFTIEETNSSGVKEAKVKHSVVQTMQQLRSDAFCIDDPLCTEFFLKFLDLIQRDMLIVEQADSNGFKEGRKGARKVAETISGMVIDLDQKDE